MFVRIIGLTEGLLSRHFTWASIQTVGTCRTYLSRVSPVGVHRASIEKSLLLLFGALFEEDFPENVLFLFMRVIILYIVVMWLIEHTIGVVVAVRILVPYSSSLTHGGVWVDPEPSIHALRP